ncbi:MAG: glycosyltransferase [Agathobacter sp.]|nr:glycosyltransferase [Agathobacter sp.]
MKVMFYISTIREGGAARVMTTLANQFVIEQYATVFFVTNFVTSTDYYVDSRVNRYSIEKEECKDSFLKKNINRVNVLRKYIMKEKPDVLISFMTENDARALVASKLTGVKVILSVRNDPNKLFPSFHKKMLATMVYGNADGVVFQTSDAQEWFPSKVQKKSRVIYNPISPKFYQVVREPRENLVVSCGRLTISKNYPLLISAFEEISEEFPDAVLEIYGEGKLRESIQGLIDKQKSNNIFLMGATDNVQNVLKKADVFVLASDYEGMPNALMEAMAAGVPCVSTDCPCGGPKSIFENEFKELLVECGNREDLIQKIKMLLSDSKYREKTGSAMKKCAEKFSTDIIAEQWIEYIKEVCDKE